MEPALLDTWTGVTGSPAEKTERGPELEPWGHREHSAELYSVGTRPVLTDTLMPSALERFLLGLLMEEGRKKDP